MFSYRTPQSSKTSSHYSQSNTFQSTLNMSDLSNSNAYGGASLYNNSSTIESDFVQQLAASNAEIDAARYDIQLLMTKAHAYCKNTGLAGNSNADAALSPYAPRYSGAPSSVSAKTSFTPTRSGEFFQSSSSHPI
ncbi:hypothetical protein M9Y10_006957 [Tritrichomonas musculus]|uniref:Uncharacterized protein n=2 Tax=Tritrichomonas musculus TaxID=1915356 RepID=A0ABR2GNA7_9EUKA